jgi:hypothetical protein
MLSGLQFDAELESILDKSQWSARTAHCTDGMDLVCYAVPAERAESGCR